ncbi:protein FAM174C [Pelmatolapia mariae]|uniref:protein FAM174C n=1 Tax=Pelmatolapia mariae TaxID=158779 RepID=UPI002FE61E3E
MTFYRSLSAVLVSVCWVLLSASEDVKSSTKTPTAVTNSSSVKPTNGTSKGPFNAFNVDSSMIQRALYVLVGITIIGVLYFLIRAVRLKKPIHRKKYGLLSNEDNAVEMDAVDSDEDDTLYESRSLRR